jgi:hypothetical protein
MAEPWDLQPYGDGIPTFLSWVNRVQHFEIVDPFTSLRTFVVADDMRQYFMEDNYRDLKRLISTLFPDARSLAGGLRENDIVPHNVAVFCTLLTIGKGWWMNYFRYYRSLSDAALPFDPASPLRDWPENADFLPQFCEAQWKFCAPVFRRPFAEQQFPPDRILPIISKEALNTDGSIVSLWRIKIHPSYNYLITEADKTVHIPLCPQIQRTNH